MYLDQDVYLKMYFLKEKKIYKHNTNKVLKILLKKDTLKKQYICITF